MSKEKLEELHAVCAELEELLGVATQEAIQEQGVTFAVSMLINVCTSMIAKASVMVDESERKRFFKTVDTLTRDKSAEACESFEDFKASGLANQH